MVVGVVVWGDCSKTAADGRTSGKPEREEEKGAAEDREGELAESATGRVYGFRGWGCGSGRRVEGR